MFVRPAYRYRGQVLTILLTRHGHTDLSEPDRYLGRRIPAAALASEGRQARRRARRAPQVGAHRPRHQQPAGASLRDRTADRRRARARRGDRRAPDRVRLRRLGRHDHATRSTTQAARRVRAVRREPGDLPAGRWGERQPGAARRAVALIDYLLEWWGGDGDRTVLLVGHSSINRVLLAAVTGVPLADYRRRFLQDWANLTVLRWADRDGGPCSSWSTTWPHRGTWRPGLIRH